MKRYIKFISYFLIAAFFSVALSGCTKKGTAVNPNANKIIVWSFEDEDVWKQVKKDFEKNNKGFTLVYEKQVFDSNYESRALNSILSGNGPDVWAMPNDWVYRHKDKLVPMPAALAKKTNLDTQYVKAVQDSVYFDKKIYALTPTVEPLQIYYNDKLFSSTLAELNQANPGTENAEARKTYNALLQGPPKTWNDFTETIKLLTKKEGDVITQSGAAIGNNNIAFPQDVLYLLMLQNQTDIVSTDLKLATFHQPKGTAKNTEDTPGKRAIDFYTSFADSTNPNYTWNTSLGSDIEAFAEGKTAMIFGYPSTQNTLTQKFPNFKYKKAAAPQLQQEPDQIVDYAHFNAFTVSNRASNSTVAWNLVNQISTATSFATATKLPTSAKAKDDTVNFKDRAGSNPEKYELLTAKTFSKGRYPVDFDNNIKDAIFSVNEKIQSSKNALELAATNITALLGKTSW